MLGIWECWAFCFQNASSKFSCGYRCGFCQMVSSVNSPATSHCPLRCGVRWNLPNWKQRPVLAETFSPLIHTSIHSHWRHFYWGGGKAISLNYGVLFFFAEVTAVWRLRVCVFSKMGKGAGYGKDLSEIFLFVCLVVFFWKNIQLYQHLKPLNIYSFWNKLELAQPQ